MKGIIMQSITRFLVILYAASISVSATIHVPDDYAKIQDAIDAVADEDIIIVRPGTYLECINFKGKAIRVSGERGPGSTIINANHSGTVVTFGSGEGLDSILEKLSLVNGNGYCGGGIRCVNASSPTIKNNIIRNNQAANKGGGILCVGSSPAIINNIIASNLADEGEMAGNKPPSFAGGICCSDHSSPTLINNTIHGNEAADGWDENGDPMYGGGGGILCDAFSSPTITNTIIWGNIASIGAEAWVGNASSLTIDFSDVKGGQSHIHLGPDCVLNWGSGMTSADPLFVDSAIGDYHLTYPSPCKDTGDSSAVTELIDFEGDPRIAYGAVDMGADEFSTHLYYTGTAAPNSTVEFKFVGLPDQSPVQLWLGSGIMDQPIHTKYGDWYLQFPLLAQLILDTIPSPSGVLIIPFTFPPDTPVHLSLPFQAGVGMELTNYCVMNIE
jgi:hypothetical protein